MAMATRNEGTRILDCDAGGQGHDRAGHTEMTAIL